MLIRNYLDLEPVVKRLHDGEGQGKNTYVLSRGDFESAIGFVTHTELPPGASIGYHGHETDDEELYIILEGNGSMRVNGEERPVRQGDIVVNPKRGSHGLVNSSDEPLKLLVIGVDME